MGDIERQTCFRQTNQIEWKAKNKKDTNRQTDRQTKDRVTEGDSGGGKKQTPKGRNKQKWSRNGIILDRKPEVKRNKISGWKNDDRKKENVIGWQEHF